MKERYPEPEMDIVTFSVADVINTSYLTPDDGYIQDPGTTFSGMGGPNEGELGDEWL